jgi:hypothetical protein
MVFLDLLKDPDLITYIIEAFLVYKRYLEVFATELSLNGEYHQVENRLYAYIVYYKMYKMSKMRYAWSVFTENERWKGGITQCFLDFSSYSFPVTDGISLEEEA